MSVGGQCGSSGGPSQGVPTCGICLSRGAPFVQGGAAGGDGGGFTTDTLDCGTVSTNALWYRMIASDTGMITVSTEGSETETLLGVYTGVWGSQSNIACYNGITASSGESRLTFNAVQGTAYWIAVDPQGNVAAPLRVAAGFQPNIQSFGLMPDGSFALKSSAGPPITYTLLSTATLSTNPSDWTVVLTTNLTARAPYINYRDTNVQGASQRFYELGPVQ